MFWDSHIRADIDLEYNILDKIPGTQFWNKAVKIGDFNGDGYDEILSINPYQSQCLINEYNREKGEMVFTLSYTFAIPGPQAPPPIIFTSYEETNCIAVHTRDHRAERYVWGLFTWNQENQKYTRIKEIWADDIDFSITGVIKERKERQNETLPPQPDVIESHTDKYVQNDTEPSVLALIAIICGMIIAAGGVVFFALKWKK
jgi:hypothetical protein